MWNDHSGEWSRHKKSAPGKKVTKSLDIIFFSYFFCTQKSCLKRWYSSNNPHRLRRCFLPKNKRKRPKKWQCANSLGNLLKGHIDIFREMEKTLLQDHVIGPLHGVTPLFKGSNIPAWCSYLDVPRKQWWSLVWAGIPSISQKLFSEKAEHNLFQLHQLQEQDIFWRTPSKSRRGWVEHSFSLTVATKTSANQAMQSKNCKNRHLLCQKKKNIRIWCSKKVQFSYSQKIPDHASVSHVGCFVNSFSGRKVQRDYLCASWSFNWQWAKMSQRAKGITNRSALRKNSCQADPGVCPISKLWQRKVHQTFNLFLAVLCSSFLAQVCCRAASQNTCSLFCSKGLWNFWNYLCSFWTRSLCHP